MAKQSASSGSSMGRMVLATIALAAVVGAAAGYSAGYLTQPSRVAATPQSRVFYLFAHEIDFNASLTSGLTSSYIYSTDHIMVNKGDSVTIHFYNPTDDDHTFTMAAPYSTDLTVLAAPNSTSPIHNVDFAFTASTAGLFNYHCRFHPPQMAGTIVVED